MGSAAQTPSRGRLWARTGAVIATIALAGICATASSAGLINGLLAPCGGQLTQPFLPWNDMANYAFVPNGGFESGATGWSLGGGAKVVSGNESFFVHGASDKSSLSLPSGASATTPAACIATLSPTSRFFVRNTGASTSTLRVDVQYTDALGLRWTVTIATLSARSSWQPTGTLPLLANLTALPVLTNGSTNVNLRFTAQGTGGAWQVDDVYIDPYKGT